MRARTRADYLVSLACWGLAGSVVGVVLGAFLWAVGEWLRSS